jgi:hypothetical protein
MGREANGWMLHDGGRHAVSLHLDSRALDLHGAVRRTIPRGEISAPTAASGVVTFSAGGDILTIELGDDAAKWAKALATTAPTLAQKLGLARANLALVIGDADGELADALEGHRAADVDTAGQVVAIVHDLGEVVELIHWLSAHAAALAVWIVHGKGVAASPSGGDVRTLMRDSGYRDTKISAISETQSATRYSPLAGG